MESGCKKGGKAGPRGLLEPKRQRSELGEAEAVGIFAAEYEEGGIYNRKSLRNLQKGLLMSLATCG